MGSVRFRLIFLEGDLNVGNRLVLRGKMSTSVVTVAAMLTVLFPSVFFFRARETLLTDAPFPPLRIFPMMMILAKNLDPSLRLRATPYRGIYLNTRDPRGRFKEDLS